ncbi:unnamed protein product [Brassica oleracea var. botrytis]
MANSSILFFNGFSSCDTRSCDERSPHWFESALRTTESRRSLIPYLSFLLSISLAHHDRGGLRGYVRRWS